MNKPKKGDVCRIFASHFRDPNYEGGSFNVLCVRTSKSFLISVSGPFEKLEQYPLSAIEAVLEGEEAMKAYRKLMQKE